MKEQRTRGNEQRDPLPLSRRQLLKSGATLSLGIAGTGIAGSSVLSACSGGTSSTHGAGLSGSGTPGNRSLIRIITVITPDESGLLNTLLTTFEKQTRYQTHVTFAQDVYGPAQAGQSDLVISHYGHVDVRSFVLNGYGRWPLAVFSNQLALIGPPGDPAHVRGLTDLVQACHQIAQTRSAYIVNTIPELVYLNDILWDAAGFAPSGPWYLNQGLQKEGAMQAAAHTGGYSLWGVTPFLKFRQQHHVSLEPLVLGDPILQRVMVAIVVNSQKVSGVNEVGATALQQFLLTPAAQAQVRTFRVAGIEQELWWPAGRNNEDDFLPKR